MSWSPSAELESLLAEVADGDLSAEAETRLAELLRDDPQARQYYRQFLELHAALQWDYVAATLPPLSSAPETFQPEIEGRILVAESAAKFAGTFRFAGVLSVALLATLLLGIGIWFQLPSEANTIVELREMSGAVNWTNRRGEARSGLQRGVSLPAGMLSVEGPGSAALLRFADGTQLTLTGESQLEFDAIPQKRIVIRQGTVLATVTPQPPGSPLLIRTPTAEIEVLGTEFSLAAEHDVTRLNVDSGRVRLRRLVDGRTVEVDPQQSVVASLDRHAALSTAPAVPSPDMWRHDFSQPWRSNWRGMWQPAQAEQPALVRTVPCIAGRQHDGTPLIQHGFTVRGVGKPFVALTPASQFTIRFRSAEPAPLRLMLGLSQPNGSFAGNFEVVLPANLQPEPAGAWQVRTLKLADFQPLIAHFPLPPQGAQVSLLFVTTLSQDAGLEVSELSIQGSKS